MLLSDAVSTDPVSSARGPVPPSELGLDRSRAVSWAPAVGNRMTGQKAGDAQPWSSCDCENQLRWSAFNVKNKKRASLESQKNKLPNTSIYSEHKILAFCLT